MWPGSEWLNVKAESNFVRILNNKIKVLALKTEWQWESPSSLSSPVVLKHWDASESCASETHIAGPSHAVWESAFLTSFQVATYVVREARSQKLASSTGTQILAFIGLQTWELEHMDLKEEEIMKMTFQLATTGHVAGICFFHAHLHQTCSQQI